MQAIHSRDLKTILHSKRANLYYLEHCRVLVNGGRVEYVTDKGKYSLYWNIPIANTTCLLLGTGTSISQAAVRELSRAGVMVGFCGGGGTPLLAATEAEIACQFFSPQSEYRPTEYLQKWCQFWFDDAKRLAAAKQLQQQRLEFIRQYWPKFAWPTEIDVEQLKQLLAEYRQHFAKATESQALLAAEGRFSKRLYGLANQWSLRDPNFKRKQGERTKNRGTANQYLDHGNYLAYGLGATGCWVLGLPHALAVLHGKTRRGGLVFDAADIIKDSMVMPQAFLSAIAGDDEGQFRYNLIQRLMDFGALDCIIDTLKQLAESE